MIPGKRIAKAPYFIEFPTMSYASPTLTVQAETSVIAASKRYIGAN